MYGVFSVIITVLILVYLFSGIAKFIVVLIYSLIIITCLVFLPNYQQPIIVIGTLAFILNPLANLETTIEKHLMMKTSYHLEYLSVENTGHFTVIAKR